MNNINASNKVNVKELALAGQRVIKVINNGVAEYHPIGLSSINPNGGSDNISTGSMEFYECASVPEGSSGGAGFIRVSGTNGYDGDYKLKDTSSTGSDRVFACSVGEIRFEDMGFMGYCWALVPTGTSNPVYWNADANSENNTIEEICNGMEDNGYYEDGVPYKFTPVTSVVAIDSDKVKRFKVTGTLAEEDVLVDAFFNREYSVQDNTQTGTNRSWSAEAGFDLSYNSYSGKWFFSDSSMTDNNLSTSESNPFTTANWASSYVGSATLTFEILEYGDNEPIPGNSSSWSGYKMIWNTDRWQRESDTPTEGLTVTGYVPEVGKVYTADTTALCYLHPDQPTVDVIATTASATDIKGGLTAVLNGTLTTGTMPTSIATPSGNVVTITEGYKTAETLTVGTAKEAETIVPGAEDIVIPADTYLAGDLTIQAVGESGGDIDLTKLTAENIKYGVTINGVSGTFTHEEDFAISSNIVMKDYVGFVNGQKVVGTLSAQMINHVFDPTVADNSSYFLDFQNMFIVVGGSQISVDVSKIDASKLAEGYTIFGITGTLVIPESTGGTEFYECTGVGSASNDIIVSGIQNEDFTFFNGTYTSVDPTGYSDGTGETQALVLWLKDTPNDDGKIPCIIGSNVFNGGYIGFDRINPSDTGYPDGAFPNGCCVGGGELGFVGIPYDTSDAKVIVSAEMKDDYDLFEGVLPTLTIAGGDSDGSTWSGYKMSQTADGVWVKAETPTEGLTAKGYTPELGKVYSQDTTIKADIYIKDYNAIIVENAPYEYLNGTYVKVPDSDIPYAGYKAVYRKGQSNSYSFIVGKTPDDSEFYGNSVLLHSASDMPLTGGAVTEPGYTNLEYNGTKLSMDNPTTSDVITITWLEDFGEPVEGITMTATNV